MEKEQTNDTKQKNTEDIETPVPAHNPPLPIDFERYAELLEGCDPDDPQVRQLLETLWNITVSFVSLGFGLHPLQQVENGCGQSDENHDQPPLPDADLLECSYEFLKENFEDVSGSHDDQKPEEMQP